MQGENERQWKKVNENKYDISSQKRVTKTFLENVVQNNGKKMYKKVCYTSKVTFFTNKTYCCFSPFSGIAFAA